MYEVPPGLPRESDVLKDYVLPAVAVGLDIAAVATNIADMPTPLSGCLMLAGGALSGYWFYLRDISFPVRCAIIASVAAPLIILNIAGVTTDAVLLFNCFFISAFVTLGTGLVIDVIKNPQD